MGDLYELRWHDGLLPRPIQQQIDDGIWVLVELCEHDRSKGHWVTMICRCSNWLGKAFGRWVDSGEEYVPGEWVECDHVWCEGAELRNG